MKHWFVPCNPRIFNIDKAIKDYNGIVDWRTKNKFEVGDIVFIYMTAPFKFIKYKMIIESVGYSHKDSAIDQEDCWLDKKGYQADFETAKLSRFKLVETYADEHFSLEELRLNGLKGLLNRTFSINGPILDYLLKE